MFAFNRKLLEARCLNAKNLNPCDQDFRQVCKRDFVGCVGTLFKSHHLTSVCHFPSYERGAKRAGAGAGGALRLSHGEGLEI